MFHLATNKSKKRKAKRKTRPHSTNAERRLTDRSQRPLVNPRGNGCHANAHVHYHSYFPTELLLHIATIMIIIIIVKFHIQIENKPLPYTGGEVAFR